MKTTLKGLLFLAALLVLAVGQAQAAIDPTTAKKLLTGDGADGEEFGSSVSVSGDTAVIGAHYDDGGKGAVYIFTRAVDGSWSQQKLTADDGAAGDEFGVSVAVSGDMAIIGACHDDDKGTDSGSAYVFVRAAGGSWSQQKKLIATDGVADDLFGSSVSVDGDTAIIGAHGNDSGKGVAYVFTRTNGVWSEQPKLTDNDGATHDYFGTSVSLAGDTAIIGASGNDSRKGAAYVFTRTGSVWSQQQKLIAADGAADDYFGSSVSVDGDTAIIGASGNDTEKGAAYVFTRTSGVWTQQQPKLTATDGSEVDWFGYSVSVDGDTVVVGASNNDTSKGAAYVFTCTGSTWNQQSKLVAADGGADDYFGSSVAVDGDTVVVGAYGDDSAKGSAYVFGGPVSAALPAINFLLLRN
ncbi:MAG: FG-GAP repeat-containing protein [Candidatus Electronema aureum]|uniref:FG-GAP repeat-containing protein n=1 Tax=Candidatus Electronema aureum TaxID=2005002 RepID=A0A521G0Y5_9BACT|nr:MAG: FG-GAP repeat-containing protein [Candidatus Electronema aureum]